MFYQVVPDDHMNRLEFLVGRFVGSQDLKLPGKDSFDFEFLCFGSRHHDERWLSIQFVAKVPGFGIESRHDFVTWNPHTKMYRWVMLSNMSAEPIILDGEFINGVLELESRPWQASWGETKLKAKLKPMECGSWTFDFSVLHGDNYAHLASLMAMPDIAVRVE